MKKLLLSLIGIMCAVAFSASAQLNNPVVDIGPYTPGSSITATFEIDPGACIKPGNTFELWLSDASGSFATETRIGEYNVFYSTFVNGTIPLSVPVGTGYRLRIKSTNPGFTSDPTVPFEIKSGTAVQASLMTSASLSNDSFGFCTNRNDGTALINITNSSTTGGIISMTTKNELTTANASIAFTDNDYATFTPQEAHYTAIVKVVMPNGTVGTRAYFIINNEVNTAFIPGSNPYVCLPGGLYEYFVDVTGVKGVQKNFPGNTYRINWGDNTGDIYTFCDLKSGRIEHRYTKTSCAQEFTSGTTTFYNVFGIIVRQESPFSCNGNSQIGNPVATTVRVVTLTNNVITGPKNICTGKPVTFTNASELGQDPNNTGPQCKPVDAKFNWYVNGILRKENVSITESFTYTFPTHGNYVVSLESATVTNCTSDRANFPVCVQNEPKPDFTLSTLTSCVGSSVNAIDASIVDGICNTNNTYRWSVTPATGVSFNATDKNPVFTFANPGSYNVTLSILTETCGEINTPVQTIVINEAPTASLSADRQLCNLATYDFNPTTTGPTRTIINGTYKDLTDTYTWTVTGGSFQFTSGTTANSRYPSIRFNDYTTYTITVTHKNNCGPDAVATQKLSFSTAPQVNAGDDQTICFNETTVLLAGVVTGTTSNVAWVGGNGTFTPNRNSVDATYTPTSQERLLGQVTLVLRATTTLPAPCNSIGDDIIIRIKPLVTVNSENAKTICTGNSVAYTPTSATPGATFTWTAVGSANASGYATSGTGAINDIITNTDATANATVTYTILPTGDGCDGQSFTLTVTITPLPAITATAANSTICSDNGSSITLTSNLTATRYTWTSTTTGSVTGSSSQSTSLETSLINDILSNNSTAPGTVTYTITPISAAGCPGQPKVVTITVEPALSQPNPGADDSICDQNTYTFNATTPTVGTGKWTQVTAFANVTIANDTQPNAIVSGLVAGNAYIFRWTISGGSCQPKSADVTITVNAPSVGGNTVGNNSVCAGSNSGIITLSGYTGSIIGWEFSTDNGANWIPRNETTPTLAYNNLVLTTQFRAIVKNGSCPETRSSITTITVNPGVVTANAGPNQALCNVTSTTLAANSPLPNTGLWTQTEGPTVTFADATSPTTAVTNLVPGQSYKFVWTITGAASCPPSTSTVEVVVVLPSIGGNTAGSTATVCAGSNAGAITLSGHLGAILRWESSTDDFVTVTTINTTGASIPFLNLTVTTKYRALVQSGSCASALSTVTTINVNQQANSADAGPDQLLCAQTSTVLAGNVAVNGIGLWTQVSGPAGATFADASLNNTSVSGLIPGGTYVFQWRIAGAAPCPATDNTLTITNLTALANNSIPAVETVCSGQTFTIIGSTPTGGNGTYTYAWESSSNGTMWATIAGATTKDYAITPSGTTFYRRTVNSGNCLSISDPFEIRVLPPIANNIISAVAPICENTQPAQLAGSAPIGGDGNSYTYKWEQSTDNITYTTISGATSQNYQPPILTTSTWYRRIVSTQTCNGPQSSTSAAVKVTVNPNAKAEFNPGTTVSCAPFNLANSNIQIIPHPGNSGYEWFVDGVSAGTGPRPNFTIQLPNEIHQVKLVAKSLFGCGNDETLEIPYRTQNEVTASFESTSPYYCGQTNLTFKNTSSIIAGAKFEWFVNGDKKFEGIDFNWTFDASVTGIDAVYNVVLKVTTGCDDDMTSAREIRIKSKPPTPALTPDKQIGCSTLTVNFTNISGGKESNRYEIDFGDGTGSKNYNWNDPITYPFPNTTSTTKNYEVTITAINECGSTVGNKVTISVLPSTISASLLFANPTQQTVCVGETVVFQNNTTGAVSYVYKFDDGSADESITTPGQHNFSHTFTKAGPVTITMIATSDCAGTATVTRTVNVVAKATAAFEADKVTGCPGLIVKFTNGSVGATRYVWNFGDGRQSFEKDAVHPYTAAGRYTVTLTAYNSLNCSTPETKTEYIVISPLPNADFQVLPGNTIGVPNFTFNFSDLNKTTIPGYTYSWDFGEGGEPISGKITSHTYREPGKYTVKYTVKSPLGCEASTSQEVSITDVAGYLHVPNSFIPGGTSVPLQTFYAVGSGIASWRMSVFNKWGQILWETNKLDDGKPMEAWDGTFKGVAQPQGIYFWKIEVQFINGTEWKGVSYDRSPPKRTGEIYLIR